MQRTNSGLTILVDPSKPLFGVGIPGFGLGTIKHTTDQAYDRLEPQPAGLYGSVRNQECYLFGTRLKLYEQTSYSNALFSSCTPKHPKTLAPTLLQSPVAGGLLLVCHHMSSVVMAIYMASGGMSICHPFLGTPNITVCIKGCRFWDHFLGCPEN